MEDKLNILSNLKKTEAPPFLYTRITQRIQTLQQAPASVKFKFAFAAAAAVVLLLNVWVLAKPAHSSPPPATMEAPSYSSTINNIYYE
jgi:hypothetical protein